MRLYGQLTLDGDHRDNPYAPLADLLPKSAETSVTAVSVTLATLEDGSKSEETTVCFYADWMVGDALR